MAKARSLFVCNQCGAEFPQYFGRCPACHAWNALEEQASSVTSSNPRLSQSPLLQLSRGRRSRDSTSEPRPVSSLTLSQIQDHPQARLASGYSELDRVLGGGIVPGSLVLIGGDPGIGKSTLLLQTANRLAQTHSILYVCAEESGQQVKLRAQRLGIGVVSSSQLDLDSSSDRSRETPQLGTSDSSIPKSTRSKQPRTKKTEIPEITAPSDEVVNPTGDRAATATGDLYLLPEIDLDAILTELESLRPRVAVIDSIQALYYAALTSAPGSVAQVRECTSLLMQLAKRLGITLFIVGHVTKEGAIAGPKVLEHLVDTVLYFEGDRFASHRLLRSVKNRFGATHEVGVFEMVDQGLQEILNPSELFLGNREEPSSGTATIVACEGTRPIVVELQALVAPTSYSSPRRSTTGIEYNRLLQILAVLEKRVGIPLSKLDAYVASSGGLSVGEPAADLGVAIAVAASFRDRTVDPQTVLIGEVGLGGQVRPVSQMELRLKEAAKLGFKRAIVPKGNYNSAGLEIIPVARVMDAIAIALVASRSNSEITREAETDQWETE
ncbi:DNA repair protein RadA [Alkalinema pantanalense CENA528]|uniref:DNA repair protein RadA n=1 Tax=Alkalinema pantanalense TaxID=1620705 RepID=UPI003D6E2CEE